MNAPQSIQSLPDPPPVGFYWFRQDSRGHQGIPEVVRIAPVPHRGKNRTMILARLWQAPLADFTLKFREGDGVTVQFIPVPSAFLLPDL